MNALSAHMLSWLLWTSVHVVLLVGLVLAVDRTTRRFLSPGWRHALWILALVPLVCPILPASRWSPLSLLHMTAGRTTAEPRPLTRDALVRSADSADGRARVGSPAPQLAAPEAGEAAAFQILPTVLVSLWAVGALALLLRQWHVARGFWRRVGGGQAVVDPAVLNELAECRQTLGLHRAARLVETDAVGSPALAGIVRPTVLLPVGLLGELSTDERQCLFLHELAHVKRWDLALDALAGLCQVLYWFNPAVHLAAARLRTTRETACDAHVLRAKGVPDWPLQYSRTLLKLASRSSYLTAMPAMAGMAERTSSIETRLRAIQQFGPARLRRHVLGMGIVVLVAMVGLSRAGDPPEGKVNAEAPSAETTVESQPAVATPGGAEQDEMVTEITLECRFIEVRGDTVEAIQKQIAEVVPPGMRPLDGEGRGETKTGIVSVADGKRMEAAANLQPGMDVLSSPKVTTVDGQALILRMVEERFLPTGWTQRDEKGDIQRGPDGTPVISPVFNGATDVGCIVEMTPHLADGGKAVDLEVAPRTVELVRWEEVTMKDARDPQTELTRPMAVLSTRESTSRPLIPIGSSACMVTSIVMGEVTGEDRVPVLSSLPLVGKAFRKEVRKPIATGLIFLVTPTTRLAKRNPVPIRKSPTEPKGIDWSK